MIYHFDGFELNTQTKSLSKQGLTIKVQPRVFMLIELLIAHRDQVLDKDTLNKAIWPGQVLAETSLTRLVMKARKALDDSSEQPKFIKTIHSFGYQFIAQVNEQPIATQSSENNANSAYSSSPKSTAQDWKNTDNSPAVKKLFRRRRMLILFASFFLLIAIILTYYRTIMPTNTDNVGHHIVVLPMVDQTDDDDYQWVSLGLPSLINSMLNESGVYSTVPLTKLKNNKLLNQSNFVPSDASITELQQQFNADIMLFSNLTKHGDSFTLNYTLMKGKNQAKWHKITGVNPTKLVQKLTEHLLQNKGVKFKQKILHSISDSPFINEAYAKAKSLQENGKIKDSLDLLNIILSEQPELFWPRYEHAVALRRLGKWQQSVTELNSLLKHPKIKHIIDAEAKTHNSIGFALYRLKKTEQAYKHYEIAHALAQQGSNYALMSGIADNLAGNYWYDYKFDQARIWLNKALIARKEGNIKATGHPYNLLGLLERDQGNLQLAEQHFRKSMQLFSEQDRLRDYAYGKISLSTVNEHKGHFQQALTNLKEAETIFAELNEQEASDFLAINFASIYLAQGDIEQAQQQALIGLEKSLKLNSKSRVAYAKFLLARIALANQEFGQAEQYLTEIQPLLDEVWAPYATFMELANAQQNKKQFKHYQQLARQDANTKDDQLYHLYIDFIIANSQLSDLSSQERQSHTKEVIRKARGLNATKILGLQLASLIKQNDKNNNVKQLHSYLEQLELLHPNWPLTQQLKQQFSSKNTRA